MLGNDDCMIVVFLLVLWKVWRIRKTRCGFSDRFIDFMKIRHRQFVALSTHIVLPIGATIMPVGLPQS
jgi:hypothetical protein